jgi:hypothetical protein
MYKSVDNKTGITSDNYQQEHQPPPLPPPPPQQQQQPLRPQKIIINNNNIEGYNLNNQEGMEIYQRVGGLDGKVVAGGSPGYPNTAIYSPFPLSSTAFSPLQLQGINSHGIHTPYSYTLPSSSVISMITQQGQVREDSGGGGGGGGGRTNDGGGSGVVMDGRDQPKGQGTSKAPPSSSVIIHQPPQGMFSQQQQGLPTFAGVSSDQSQIHYPVPSSSYPPSPSCFFSSSTPALISHSPIPTFSPFAAVIQSPPIPANAVVQPQQRTMGGGTGMGGTGYSTRVAIVSNVRTNDQRDVMMVGQMSYNPTYTLDGGGNVIHQGVSVGGGGGGGISGGGGGSGGGNIPISSPHIIQPSYGIPPTTSSPFYLNTPSAAQILHGSLTSPALPLVQGRGEGGGSSAGGGESGKGGGGREGN